MEIALPSELRPLCAGRDVLDAAGATFGEALQGLAERHSALVARILPGGGLAPDVDLLYEGRDLRLRGGLKTPLPRGARVEIRLVRAPLRDMERYSRQVILSEVGLEGQERLAEARVLVVGAGGLGAPALTYLAAAGIGHLGIVDGDVVERSNLHRQPLHRDEDVGTGKAESARRALLALNPEIEVIVHPVYLTAANAQDILSGYDLVVNGSDNFPTRYLLNDAANLLGLAWVDASILRFEGQVAVYLPGGGCYRCLFPSPPPPGSVPSCAEAGIIGALAGEVGAIQALEAVKLILGAGESLAGRLPVIDGLGARSRSFPISRDPGCPVCSQHPTQFGLIDYEAFCGAPLPGVADAHPPELSAREAYELVGVAGTQWLDVRPPAAGVRPTIAGAVFFPLEEIASGELPLDPSRAVIAFCDIGRRSRIAVDLLRQRGYRARGVEGGLAAWRAAGLPLHEDSR